MSYLILFIGFFNLDFNICISWYWIVNMAEVEIVGGAAARTTSAIDWILHICPIK